MTPFLVDIVLLNFWSLKHEKGCGTKIVTRMPSSGVSSPNFHNRLHKLSESFKSVAQGVLEIFEEVYLHNVPPPPPPGPLVGIGLIARFSRVNSPFFPHQISHSLSAILSPVSPVSGINAFLICAYRSADFLRWCLSLELNLAHTLFFYFQ